MGYHLSTCLGFKPNAEGHGHIYIIVYDNMPILGRWVHLGMVNNIVNVIYKLLERKNRFQISMWHDHAFLGSKYEEYGSGWHHPNFHTKWNNLNFHWNQNFFDV